MKRPTAFISYRRHDSFVTDAKAPATTPFLQALLAALDDLGFNAFIDFEAIEYGDQFDEKILREIKKCDLFLALIGPRWIDELDTRRARGERDVAAREVIDAIELDKVMLSIQVDGAEWPQGRDLPERLAILSSNNAISFDSAMSSEEMAAKLKPTATRVERLWRFDGRWEAGYVGAGIIAYLLTAFVPNIVGLREFGDAWFDLALTWGGLFVWPIFFLPFALLALEVPMRAMLRAVILAGNVRDRIVYAAPFVVAIVATGMALPVELFGVEQSPWSVSVRFDPALGPPFCGTATRYADSKLAALVHYDAGHEILAKEVEDGQFAPYWLEQKCWPNAFFYLISKSSGSPDQINERARVQSAFMAALRTDDHTRRHISYSNTFYAYAVSFAVLSFLGLYGISITIFLAYYRIRRGWDNMELRRYSDDAWQCLTYSFIALMLWTPFRMITVARKGLYYCKYLSGCSVHWVDFYSDILIGGILLIGYIYLTVGLIRHTKRFALGALSAICVIGIIMLGVLAAAVGDEVATRIGLWRVYLGISIPAIVILMALWFQFSPSVVRFDEARRGLITADPAKPKRTSV